jgi:hypothetical protein
MFYETMVDELSTIGAGITISETHSNDDVSFDDEDDTNRRQNA